MSSSSSSAAIPAYRPSTSTPPSGKRKVTKPAVSRSSQDPFYGHEETAVMSARFITSLFQCPNIPAATAPGAPTPTLAHFVAYALHRTRLPSVVTFAALMLLSRLKQRYPAARGSSGHRLFISAFMIASKVICDDTYSNQSWSIVAQKMFALKEINQMEREMCGYLEWNLNVAGDEIVNFEAKIRSEHGPRAVARASSASSSSSSEGSVIVPVPVVSASRSYPTPETTPDPQPASRPIRAVPSPYKSRVTYQPQQPAFPSPPISPIGHHSSPHPPHFTSSASSSLQSSPASDDCKTPSPVTLTGQHHHHGRSSSRHPQKGFDMTRAFDGRSRAHAVNMHLTGEPIHVGGW
ncbi:uncharacterized protein I303_104463 [Kwoniella dejecticola CBS 10117]|uniref:Alternative cyclin Pcl12 n=1 Tax=Kwoniella dejecticola CBS 10117 TaxID=1296121 RepID=A0A1A6A598_9TREE|nr:alternative cyclin Pcl12 [Kwoniella dejecticola CBS 10117]OBR85226.1 alternative cyclin Pcl12 [Kwoniella dejecticola CBS 10117]